MFNFGLLAKELRLNIVLDIVLVNGQMVKLTYSFSCFESGNVSMNVVLPDLY